MPSAKYSFSLSSLKLSKGRTAIDLSSFRSRRVRQHQKPTAAAMSDADSGEQVDIAALRPQRRRAIFRRLDRRRSLKTVRPDVKRPREHERDREAREHRDDQQTQRPMRKLERRENGRADLDQQPADDSVGGRDAIDFAAPQFTEETVQLTIHWAFLRCATFANPRIVATDRLRLRDFFAPAKPSESELSDRLRRRSHHEYFTV